VGGGGQAGRGGGTVASRRPTIASSPRLSPGSGDGHLLGQCFFKWAGGGADDQNRRKESNKTINLGAEGDDWK